MSYSADEVKKINNATSQFYEKTASSFSETRKNPWDGWKKVVQVCEFSKISTININDVGCGNLRFEKFLGRSFPDLNVNCNAYDNCKKLVETNSFEVSNLRIGFKQINIVEELLNDTFVLKGASNLCVAFGLMHHIPTYELRRKFIQACLNSVSRGGYLVLSFWQFANDAKLAKKAEKATLTAQAKLKLGQLEPNDYFLHWQSRDDIFRFCHHFDSEEIDELCKFDSCNTICQFCEDGKNHKLNKYVIVQKT